MTIVRREHPPVTLTCADLLASDPTFASAIGKWVADRRCPVALGDYLDELGLPAAADCARWCAEEPVRPSYRYPDLDYGPFPEHNLMGDEDRDWYWHISSSPVENYWSNSIPGGRVKLSASAVRARCEDTTPELAIVWLLDNWVPRTAHDLYTDADVDVPSCIRDQNGSVVLGLCKRCGRAESELDELCGPRPAES